MAEMRKTSPQTEVAVSVEGAYTLADLRDFLGRCDQLGIPDTAEPNVRATIGGKIKKLTVRGPSAKDRHGTTDA